MKISNAKVIQLTEKNDNLAKILIARSVITYRINHPHSEGFSLQEDKDFTSSAKMYF